MTNKEIAELALENSLAYHLSEYPHFPANAVRDLVAEDNEDIIVWEPFQWWETDSLIEAIDNMASTLEEQYKEVRRRTLASVGYIEEVDNE